VAVEISEQFRDTVQKHLLTVFGDAGLVYFGVFGKKVKELASAELPVVKVKSKRMDLLFLLEDNSYVHFEFITKYKVASLINHALYDALLFELKRRPIKTVPVCAHKCGKVPDVLNMGSLVFAPQKIMPGSYDGDAILADLESKLKGKIPLSDVDILNLALLPLMRHTQKRYDMVIKTIKIAKAIPDETKRNASIASIFSFANQYATDSELRKLEEEINMASFIDKVVAGATAKVEFMVEEDRRDTAKYLLSNFNAVMTTADIAAASRLDIAAVEALKAELEEEKE
jgi:hypothetical protein